MDLDADVVVSASLDGSVCLATVDPSARAAPPPGQGQGRRPEAFRVPRRDGRSGARVGRVRVCVCLHARAHWHIQGFAHPLAIGLFLIVLHCWLLFASRLPFKQKRLSSHSRSSVACRGS